MLLRALPRATRATSRRWSSTSPTSTTRSTTRRARRACRRPSTPSEMTAAYIEDTDRLGLGRPDAEPLATETIAEIVALIEALIERGHAYESGGDVYFRVRSFDGYGKLSNRDPDEMDQGEEAGTAELKEDPLDFALWKARKPGEDTSWPSPVGRGAPGLAHRVLGDGREAARRRLRDPRRRLGPDLPPPRERDRPDRGGARACRSRGSGCTTGWSGPPTEKMSKSVGNIFQLSEAIDRFGARGRGRLPGLRPLPPAARVLRGRRSRRPQARLERIRNFLARGAEPAASADPFVAERREAFLDALADDFNTPRALAALFELIAEGNRRPLPGAREARRASCCRCSGSSRCSPRPATTRRRRGRGAARRARARRAPSATSSAPTRSATSSPSSAGRSATTPDGRPARPRGPERSARRGRLRPPARSPRRSAGAGGCAGSGRRDGHRRRRADPAGRLARPPGRRRRGRPLSLRRRRPRCSSSRRRAGRRPRPGPGPAQPRRRLPLRRGGGRDRRRDPRAPRGRGHAGGLQGLGGRGRAPADRPRAQPRRLARRGQGARAPGSTAPRRAPSALHAGRPDRQGRARARQRGQGAAAAGRRRAATCWSRSRCGGGSASLNVSAAAAVLLFEAVRQRGGGVS